MAIELGQSRLNRPDETTFEYVKAASLRPQAQILTLRLNTGKHCKMMKMPNLTPWSHSTQRTSNRKSDLGTNPGQVIAVDEPIPAPESFSDRSRKARQQKPWLIWAFEAGKSFSDHKVDKVFVGSCTNSRMKICAPPPVSPKGRKVASHVQALIVLALNK